MLYFNRTVLSKGIDVNKTSTSKECINSYYQCVLDKQFQATDCHECHTPSMLVSLELAKMKPRIY